MKLSAKEKTAFGLGAVGKDMVYMLSARLYSVLLPGCSRSKCDGNGNYSHGSAGV